MAVSAKAFLNETRESFLTCQLLTAQAQKYRDMATRASGGKRAGQQIEKYVLKLMDVHAELQEEVNRLVQKRREAEKLILSLENEKYRAVLTAYYLCGYRWQEVADKTNFTLRWVHNLHKAAIDELERRYEA